MGTCVAGTVGGGLTVCGAEAFAPELRNSGRVRGPDEKFRVRSEFLFPADLVLRLYITGPLTHFRYLPFLVAGLPFSALVL